MAESQEKLPESNLPKGNTADVSEEEILAKVWLKERYTDQLIHSNLDFLAKMLVEYAAIIERRSCDKYLVAKSGRKYRSVPDDIDIETWDNMTVIERLCYKGVIVEIEKPIAPVNLSREEIIEAVQDTLNTCRVDCDTYCIAEKITDRLTNKQ
jgi:hypothetical protein